MALLNLMHNHFTRLWIGGLNQYIVRICGLLKATSNGLLNPNIWAAWQLQLSNSECKWSKTKCNRHIPFHKRWMVVVMLGNDDTPKPWSPHSLIYLWNQSSRQPSCFKNVQNAYQARQPTKCHHRHIVYTLLIQNACSPIAEKIIIGLEAFLATSIKFIFTRGRFRALKTELYIFC